VANTSIIRNILRELYGLVVYIDLLIGEKLGLEWPLTLDVPALIADGWNPAPFREFIVKIHSRCDLSCDYCYMYEMADQSWRDQPRRMAPETAKHTANCIGQHVRGHRTSSIALVLHGGEPLLAGRDLMSYLVCATREAVGPEVQVRLASRLMASDWMIPTYGCSTSSTSESESAWMARPMHTTGTADSPAGGGALWPYLVVWTGSGETPSSISLTACFVPSISVMIRRHI